MSGTVRLIHGDCLEVLRSLPAGSVDAVVTDPPYGVDYWHSGGGGIGAQCVRPSFPKRQSRKRVSGDDRPFDPTPWLSYPCLMWGANHFADRLPRVGSWLVWDKSCGKGPADSFIDADFGWCSIPGIKRNICRYLWKGLMTLKVGEDNGRRYHPMQKPVGLMQWCVRTMRLKPGSIILDPYMGSGATGIAAVREGMSFVGIEIDPDFFSVAEGRIAKAQAEALTA